ncbi:hypothetical protein ACFL1G_01795 [Planctomycetota bacterium]
MGTKTDPAVVEELKRRGHKIRLRDFWQMRTVITFDQETGMMHGAGDPNPLPPPYVGDRALPRHAAAF